MENWTFPHSPLKYKSLKDIMSPYENGWVEPRDLTLEDILVPNPEPIERIAGVFPKGKMTLVHGKYGTGKSFNILQMINNQKIEPFYIMLEDPTGLENMNKKQAGSELLIRLMTGKTADTLLKDSVIIIDTYTRMKELHQFNSMGESEISDRLEDISIRTGATLIIIGHSKEFASNNDIFTDNEFLPRNASEVVTFTKKVPNTKDKNFRYHMTIQKGRGIGGSSTIEVHNHPENDSTVLKQIKTF